MSPSLMPGPEVAALPAPWPFVGRRAQREMVRRTLLDPRAGGLLIRGPAGIGKSRLVSEVVHDEGAAQRRLLALRGLQSRRQVPFGCMAEQFPELLANASAGAGELLGRAVRLIHDARFDAIWVDDAADVDDSSALVLHFLATEGRLPVLFTARTGESLPEPLVALRVSGAIDLLTLGPLADEEVAELVEAALGGQVDTPTARRFVLLSEGSPLHLRELVRAVLERGVMEVDGGVRHWARSATGAWALGGLVAERLERLSPPAFRACGLVALADGLPRPVVVDLVGVDAVREAEHAGVMVPADGGVLSLAHPLHRDVMMDGLAEADRVSLCRALARTFGIDGPIPDPLRAVAFQARAGDQVDPQVLAGAAAESLRRSQPGIAERLYLRLADHDPVEGHLGLGAALLDLGRDQEAERSFRTAEDLAESPDQWARASIGRARAGRWLPPADRERSSSVPAPEPPALGDVAPALRNGLLVEQATSQVLLLQTSAAIATLGEVGDEAALGLELRRRAVGAWALVTMAVGRGSDQLVRLDALAAGVHRSTGGGSFDDGSDASMRIAALSLLGDGVAIGRYAAELRGRAAPADPGGGHALDVIEAQATADLLAGDVGAAARGFRELAAAQARRQGVHLRGLVALHRLAAAEALHGDAPAAAAAADAAATAWIGMGERGGLGSVEVRLAQLWAAVASDDRTAAVDQGRDLANELVAVGCFASAAEAGWLAWRASGGVETPEGLPVALEQVQGPASATVAAQLRAVRDGDAVGVLAAAEALARLGRWVDAAEAAVGAAGLFAGAGEQRRAVMASCSADGFRTRCPDARLIWPASELELPRLSERESEVATLVAAGLSNRAIADLLVLSVRTVEGHVLRSSAKLGVTSRSQLGEVFALRGT